MDILKLIRKPSIQRQIAFLGVTLGCVCLMFIVMHMQLVETVSANPIVIEPDYDTFEFHWPFDMTPPEQLYLECSDASGKSIYSNTIKCDGSTCTGDERVRVGYAKYQITDCKLMMTVNGRGLVVHYGRPLPIECRVIYQEEFEIEINSEHPEKATPVISRIPVSDQCIWRFDLSNSADLLSVSSDRGSRLTNPGAQPDLGIFLLALLLAWLVEIPVLLLMTRILFRLKAISIQRIVLVGALMTLLTLPILWYVLPGILGPILYVPVGEALVILTESVILKFGLKINSFKALLMSLIANIFSYSVGLLIL